MILACTKHAYTTPTHAWASLERHRNRKRGSSVYHCPYCHLWHITSKKQGRK